MRILLLFLTFTFAAELEVEGDLKVTGNIDAQNNPIKNVGIPQALTDAINGNVLQDALRDDGPFEIKILLILLTLSDYNGGYIGSSKWCDLEDIDIGTMTWGNNINTLPEELSSLYNDGWALESINDYGGAGSTGGTFWIFKRPIEEE